MADVNVELTIANVTDPNVSFGDGVLAGALRKQATVAKERFDDLTSNILTMVRSERARLATRKNELQKQLDDVTKEEAELLKAIEVANTNTSKGVLPLAAHVNMKCEVVKFMKANGIAVPANDDKVWSV